MQAHLILDKILSFTVAVLKSNYIIQSVQSFSSAFCLKHQYLYWFKCRKNLETGSDSVPEPRIKFSYFSCDLDGCCCAGAMVLKHWTYKLSHCYNAGTTWSHFWAQLALVSWEPNALGLARRSFSVPRSQQKCPANLGRDLVHSKSDQKSNRLRILGTPKKNWQHKFQIQLADEHISSSNHWMQQSV